MAKLRLRLAEKDRPDYERGDEWFTVHGDLRELDDLPWDDLDALERELEFSAYVLTQVERRAVTARYWRALLWLARRFAGIVEPYATFKPNIRRMEMEPVDDDLGEGDADPPADTPSGSPATSPSASPSSPSTPPSRGTTTSPRRRSAA